MSRFLGFTRNELASQDHVRSDKAGVRPICYVSALPVHCPIKKMLKREGKGTNHFSKTECERTYTMTPWFNITAVALSAVDYV